MAFPVTLNGRTYTLADFSGTNYVEGFPDALEDFVTQAGDIYNSTSSTSNAIGIGSKTFTVDSGKPYQAGTPLRIADAAAPATNFMDVIVTSYSGTSLVVSVFGFAGSGTYTSWTVNIGGAKTIDGTLPVAQGGTGATTAADARTNLDTYSKAEADSRFLNVSGEASDVTMTGNVTIGDAGTDTLTVNATATMADATLTTADINGGTIDGTVIGGSTPAAISGTTGQFGTSLNVDGTVTADGLTVTGTLANWSIDTQGVIQTFTRPSTSYIRASDAAGNIGIQTGGSINRALFASNGDISFYEDTGTTPKFFWDASAESLGIGTSPATILHVNAGAAFDTNVRLQAGASGNHAKHTYSDLNNTVQWTSGYQSSTGKFAINAGDSFNATGLTITSTGLVGIGTSIPAERLHVEATASFGYINSTGQGTSGLYLAGNSGSSSITQFGGEIRFSTGGTANTAGTGAAERARINSDGELLVGTTNSSVFAGTTSGINVSGNNGFIGTSRGGAPSAIFNRHTSDGAIAEFRRNGTTVGSIGNSGGSVTIGSGATGIAFVDSFNGIFPQNGTAGRDAAIDLGWSGGRFKDLYLSGGVYLGGTTSANLLDDYEEGTWNPQWGAGVSASYSGATVGSYTKIGNTVHIYFYLAWSSKTGGSGFATIVGLPFSTSGEPAAYFYYTDGFSKIVDRGRVQGSVVQFGQRSSAGLDFHTTGEINASGLIIGNATYRT